MDRDEMRGRIADRRGRWDLAIIGGGATGMGIAVDASSRGYEVILLEGDDLARESLAKNCMQSSSARRGASTGCRWKWIVPVPDSQSQLSGRIVTGVLRGRI
jgi:glycine/D-amino acid oxidase-like deaminating enzyme